MAGNDIANKVKSGLNKASVKTGDGTSAIYLNKKVRTAGTPITPPTEVITPILLVDAITKNIDKKLIDNDLIRGGDINLVSNGDIEIVQNDEIDINGKIYAVEAVDVKKPSNVPLAYISQLRAQ
jgi:hypothetical protein